MGTLKKAVYFASDFHLGAPNYQQSREREQHIVSWLEEVEEKASALYLVGDIFDFWFEYKTVVPKGYTRFLGALARISDAGIPVHIFTGNHDMWMKDYLEKEIGVKLYRGPAKKKIGERIFFIGHGDGLGPGDYKYKVLKRIFSNPICQWLFARLHPNFGIALANFWSKKSRAHTGSSEDGYLGDDKEFLVQYCIDHSNKEADIDYFVFGHRHFPLEKNLGIATYINTGDWIKHNTYAVFDGINIQLLTYSPT